VVTINSQIMTTADLMIPSGISPPETRDSQEETRSSVPCSNCGTDSATRFCHSCASSVCDFCMVEQEDCCITCCKTFPSSPVQPSSPCYSRQPSSPFSRQPSSPCYSPGGHNGVPIPSFPQPEYSVPAGWLLQQVPQNMQEARNRRAQQGYSGQPISAPMDVKSQLLGTTASPAQSMSPMASRNPWPNAQLAGPPGNFHAPRKNSLAGIHGNFQDGPSSPVRKTSSDGCSGNCATATTMMICNIPCRFGQEDIVEAIKSVGFAGRYDFVYLPNRNGKRDGNIGYAFVNFKNCSEADAFAAAFQGYQFPGTQSNKKCTVKHAHQQGFNGQVRDIRRPRR